MLGWWPIVAWGVAPDGVTNPRPRGGWVADEADVIPPDVEAELDRRLSRLDRDLGVEIAVVTVPEADRAPKAFATDLFALWGIGKAGADNGLLVLLVMDQRRVEIETGYGIEPILTDSWLGRMEDRSMVPAFRDGDFGRGLVAGVAEIDDALRARPDEARGLVAPRDPARDWLLVGAGSGVLGGLGAAAALVVRRRRRTCPQCRVYMPMLDEDADDAHLSPGQRAEEQVGSMDYQVHMCPQCGEVRTFAVHRWFSGYDRCDRCGNRTRRTQREVVVPPTTLSEGRMRVTEECAHCGARARYTRSIPRTQPVSHHHGSGGGFGGGGGGGSFGGGHSGGGGAGRSW